MTEKFGIVIDWTSINIIPYLDELMNKYVNYEITTSTIWIVINLIIFVGSCVFLGILFKNKNIGTATYESGFVEKDKKIFFYTISYTSFFVTLLVI